MSLLDRQLARCVATCVASLGLAACTYVNPGNFACNDTSECPTGSCCTSSGRCGSCEALTADAGLDAGAAPDAGDAGRGFFDAGLYCQGCTRDNQCGGAGSRCVNGFCGLVCAGPQDCPPAATCTPVADGGSNCLPTIGFCPVEIDGGCVAVSCPTLTNCIDNCGNLDPTLCACAGIAVCAQGGPCIDIPDGGDAGLLCMSKDDCRFGEACTPQGCVPPPASCATDSQCARGEICNFNETCTAGCDTNQDCVPPLVCDPTSFLCALCTATVPCPNGLICVAGNCESPTPPDAGNSCTTNDQCVSNSHGNQCVGSQCGCFSRSDCPPGAPYKCKDSLCTLPALCEVCICDDGTCPFDQMGDCDDSTNCLPCTPCTCDNDVCPINHRGDCANGTNCLDAGPIPDGGECTPCICPGGACPFDSAGDCDGGTNCLVCDPCTCDNNSCPINSSGLCRNGTNCLCSPCTCADGTCPIIGTRCDGGTSCGTCEPCTCDNGTCPIDSFGDCNNSTNCLESGCFICTCDNGTCPIDSAGNCNDGTNCSSGPPCPTGDTDLGSKAVCHQLCVAGVDGFCEGEGGKCCDTLGGTCPICTCSDGSCPLNGTGICSNGSNCLLEPRDAGPADAGGHDAGLLSDAGIPDAGNLDAGPIPDGGETYDCSELESCIANCGSNLTCQSACISLATGDAVDLYNALEQCIFPQNCPQTGNGVCDEGSSGFSQTACDTCIENAVCSPDAVRAGTCSAVGPCYADTVACQDNQ